MELAKDAAKAGNGDLYILHVAQGENILESGEMYEMQRLADYGCRLGGQVCLCCEQDVAAYISRFAREKDITGVLLEPPVKKEKKSIWKELLERIAALLPPGTCLLSERELAAAAV